MIDSVYKALINSNPIIEFDPNGNILWANKSYLELLGYSLSEIQDQHHSIFLKEEEKNTQSYLEMWRFLSVGQKYSGEFCRLNKSGKSVWIQGSYNPVIDPNNKVIKIIKLAVDITEKKDLAENLERKILELASAAARAKAATNSKSIFLANMSHEIRTPLNSIIGITDTLAESQLDEQQRGYIEILQRANQQLMTIIEDILDLSKVEAGEIEINKFTFDLRLLIQEVNSVLGFRALEKALFLKIDLATDIEPYFFGDANRLRQILINLLNNAIKFTHRGGVTLRISKNNTRHPGNILFCIEDTGIGISKQGFREIFKPFTQADSKTTRKYGGSGLGLSITKNFIQLMNGHIWLESELKVGSRFYFTIDLEPGSVAKIATIDDAELPAQFLENKTENRLLKILIVDDVDDNRNLFGIYLRNSGHDIVFATGGIEAVELAKYQNFDIIFMDVQMPEMDGYEATNKIRKLEIERHQKPSKIFACTANAFNEDIAKSLLAGCDLHLSKPIRKDTLIKAVNSYFNSEPTGYLV